MKKYCFANGKITTLEKACVPVNDLAVLRGYAVFDFLKTVNERPFLWREHWQRFKNSAKLLDLAVPVGEGEVLLAIKSLLKKNKVKEASVRLLLTGGASEDGLAASEPNFYILLEDVYRFPARCFTHGAKLITADYRRVVPGAKSTNYLATLRLQKAKKKAGASEILLVDQGRVLECSTSNFFLVTSGKIVTAPEDVLLGTIRNKVIELAIQNKIEVEEREIKVGELAMADEAFLTATSKDVMPVVQIDGQKIANGRIGPVTKRLMQLFAELVKNY